MNANPKPGFIGNLSAAAIPAAVSIEFGEQSCSLEFVLKIVSIDEMNDGADVSNSSSNRRLMPAEFSICCSVNFSRCIKNPPYDMRGLTVKLFRERHADVVVAANFNGFGCVYQS